MTKQPMQADGGARRKGAPDGVLDAAPSGKEGGGESGGGAYPNPHTGKTPDDGLDGFMGHGGQSVQDYHGSAAGGDDQAEAAESADNEIPAGGSNSSSA